MGLWQVPGGAQDQNLPSEPENKEDVRMSGANSQSLGVRGSPGKSDNGENRDYQNKTSDARQGSRRWSGWISESVPKPSVETLNDFSRLFGNGDIGWLKEFDAEAGTVA